MSKDFFLFYFLYYSSGNKAVSINAITMALIDAGIPMRDYVCATSATLINDIPIVGKGKKIKFQPLLQLSFSSK